MPKKQRMPHNWAWPSTIFRAGNTTNVDLSCNVSTSNINLTPVSALICLYYDWDYQQAAALLDEVIPQLTAFSPQERSVYYWADAESHFHLNEYDAALPLYQQQLTLCQENERADAYYKIGIIMMSREDWLGALDNLQNALVYYRKYQPSQESRISQIRNMITGVCEKLR